MTSRSDRCLTSLFPAGISDLAEGAETHRGPAGRKAETPSGESTKDSRYILFSAALSKRGGMEPDDLLCSRNARPQKDGEGAARCPSCSQNAHDETVLVRCAQ